MDESQPSQEDTKFEERLIEEVRRYAHLSTVTTTNSQDLQRCENSWEEISKNIMKEKAKCKSKWKYLRDTYIRKKKENTKKSGSGRGTKLKWEYFDALSFLDSCEVKSKSTTNIPLRETGNDLGGGLEMENNFPETTTVNQAKKSKTPDRLETLLVDALTTWKQSISLSQQNKELSEDESFGRSVALQIHKLSVERKARVKLRIQEIICEAEESELLMGKENEFPVDIDDDVYQPILNTHDGSFFQLH